MRHFATDAQGKPVEIPVFMPVEDWARLARRYYLCHKLYDQPDWYNWRLDNWGSRSSLSSFHMDYTRCSCIFETPWTHPFAFIETLSRHYPEDELTVEFAEEFLGENAGRYLIRNSVRTRPEAFADGSREACEVGFSLWGGEEYYRLDEKRQTCILIDDDGKEGLDDMAEA